MAREGKLRLAYYLAPPWLQGKEAAGVQGKTGQQVIGGSQQAAVTAPAAAPAAVGTNALVNSNLETADSVTPTSPECWAQETYGSDFLFVTGYPTAKRAFYTHPNPAEPEYSNSFDLLFRGLELVSGGQRLHRQADYLAVMRERPPEG